MSKTRVSNSVSNSVRRRFAARDIQRGDYASRRINALKLRTDTSRQPFAARRVYTM